MSTDQKPEPLSDEQIAEVLTRIRHGICTSRVSGAKQTCRESYGIGSWCTSCLGHALLDVYNRLVKEAAIASLAVPLEDELSGRIDDMLKHLAMQDGFTLAGIARLLSDVQRRMSDDWLVIGRERRERLSALRELQQRRAAPEPPERKSCDHLDCPWPGCGEWPAPAQGQAALVREKLEALHEHSYPLAHEPTLAWLKDNRRYLHTLAREALAAAKEQP